MSRGAKIALVIGGIILAIIIILPPALNIVDHYKYGYGGWEMMGPGIAFGYGGGLIMGIFMILFWGLIIWGIIALVRYLIRNSRNGYPGNSALEILNRRYASGEINKEEYDEKKKVLT